MEKNYRNRNSKGRIISLINIYVFMEISRNIQYARDIYKIHKYTQNIQIRYLIFKE